MAQEEKNKRFWYCCKYPLESNGEDVDALWGVGGVVDYSVSDDSDDYHTSFGPDRLLKTPLVNKCVWVSDTVRAIRGFTLQFH